MIPSLPVEFADHDMTETELASLWHNLIVELLDEKFNGRTHHNRRTYDAGCRGPLCGKSVRVRARLRNQTSPNEYYKFIDPILDYWTPIAEQRIEQARANLLEQLTA